MYSEIRDTIVLITCFCILPCIAFTCLYAWEACRMWVGQFWIRRDILKLRRERLVLLFERRAERNQARAAREQEV